MASSSEPLGRVLATPRRSSNAFYLSFKAACAKLGLDPKLNVHSLRHTFGTRTAKPALVQTLMGHGSYKTTQQYVHLVDDDLLAATAGLV